MSDVDGIMKSCNFVVECICFDQWIRKWNIAKPDNESNRDFLVKIDERDEKKRSMAFGKLLWCAVLETLDTKY